MRSSERAPIDWDRESLLSVLDTWEALERDLLALPVDAAIKGWHRVEHGPVRRNRPLVEQEVLNFERGFGVPLPDDYRWLITTVANGHDDASHSVLVALEDANDDPEHLTTVRPDRPAAEEYWWGTLGIGDIGCAMSARLVVTGDEPGVVWIDGRSNAGPGYAFGKEPPMTFRDYYTGRLAAVTQRLQNQLAYAGRILDKR